MSGWREEQALFDLSYLPQRPLCGHEKNGPKYRRTREQALSEYKYIETNPLCLKNLIICDIDARDVADATRQEKLPRESWAVRTNNLIGSGHIGYALKTPVILTDAARRRPINLLSRIETGLIDVLGADISYSGRITKNPLIEDENQTTLWQEEFPTYGLRELADPLDKLGALPKWNDPKHRQSSGVGRNVDIFDRTRKWAYTAVRRYWNEDFDTWREVVEAKTTFLNLALEAEGRIPLPNQEIHHLSRSISKWVWQRFKPEKFSAIQRARAEKRGQETLKRIEELINEHNH